MSGVAHLVLLLAAEALRPASSGPTEADWVRWVGVGVSVVGAMLTAINGVMLAARWVWSGSLKGWGWLKGMLARWIPWVRRSVHVQGHTASVSASATLGTVVIRAWDEKASLKVKVERLHAELEAQRKELDQLRSDLTSKTSELSARIDAQEAQFRAEISRLEGIIRSQEEDSARADARGLIPVAIGIVMVSLPDGLSNPHALGWTVIGLAVISTAWITRAVLASVRRPFRAA